MIQKVVAFLSIVLAGSAVAGQGIVRRPIDRSNYYSTDTEIYEAWGVGVQKNAKTLLERAPLFSKYYRLIRYIVEQKENFDDEDILNQLRDCVQGLDKDPGEVRSALEDGWRDEKENISEEDAELAADIYCDIVEFKYEKIEG